LAYSSAYFTHADQRLHDVHTAKLDRICGNLGLRAGMRLLDIGSRWVS
jgi:cyclopropane fatty-acyl-phospholipid synthase-like methyltransferase